MHEMITEFTGTDLQPLLYETMYEENRIGLMDLSDPDNLAIYSSLLCDDIEQGNDVNETILLHMLDMIYQNAMPEEEESLFDRLDRNGSKQEASRIKRLTMLINPNFSPKFRILGFGIHMKDSLLIQMSAFEKNSKEWNSLRARFDAWDRFLERNYVEEIDFIDSCNTWIC